MLWQTLLFHHGNSAIALGETIKAWAKSSGYKPYDPFPGGLGAPIGHVSRLRMFLAPTLDTWQRLHIAPQDSLPSDLLENLSASSVDVLHIQVPNPEEFSVQRLGHMLNDWESFVQLLKTDKTIQDLQFAATKALVTGAAEPANLPPELQQMATEQGLKAGDVEKLMGKMSKRVFKKAAKHDTAADIEQAQAALSGQTVVMDWGSLAGQRLSAVMDCLTVPDVYWRDPAWATLTGAYQVARQQKRGRDMLLPNDEEKLQAVPNVLDFELLYFSKKLTS